jgi:hypothetical protein
VSFISAASRGLRSAYRIRTLRQIGWLGFYLRHELPRRKVGFLPLRIQSNSLIYEAVILATSLLFLDAYPMALKIVRYCIDEAISESPVGVIRIISVESEAFIAEDLDAADTFYIAC